MSTARKRAIFGTSAALLLFIEILIGMFAHGWVRSYLGDVLVVMLLYAIARTVSPDRPEKTFILPSLILIFSFAVEFLQLWGFCDRFGITDSLLRTIIGTGFSVIDLLCYAAGSIPCFAAEYAIHQGELK